MATDTDAVLDDLWFEFNEGDEDSPFGTLEDVVAQRSLAAKLAEINGLKTFPVVAQRVLAMVSTPDFKVPEVTKVLREDPSLAAGVLRMANSPLFFGATPCASIDQAIVRLGGDVVRDVVAAVATMALFPDDHGMGKRIRDHCASSAALVSALARVLASAYVGPAFLAGLMHDVGKMLLVESREMIYAAEDVEDLLRPDVMHHEERALMGYDHAVLGGHVLHAWGLPEPIPLIVAWHHQPERAYADAEARQLVALVRVADRLDFLLREDPEDRQRALADLESHRDLEPARLELSVLERRWDVLVEAHAGALKMFGG